MCVCVCVCVCGVCVCVCVCVCVWFVCVCVRVSIKFTTVCIWRWWSWGQCVRADMCVPAHSHSSANGGCTWRSPSVSFQSENTISVVPQCFLSPPFLLSVEFQYFFIFNHYFVSPSTLLLVRWNDYNCSQGVSKHRSHKYSDAITAFVNGTHLDNWTNNLIFFILPFACLYFPPFDAHTDGRTLTPMFPVIWLEKQSAL